MDIQHKRWLKLLRIAEKAGQDSGDFEQVIADMSREELEQLGKLLKELPKAPTFEGPSAI